MLMVPVLQGNVEWIKIINYMFSDMIGQFHYQYIIR